MAMKSNEELIAEFYAKGGKPAVVEAGHRAMSEKDMWYARRGEKKPVVVDESDFYREQTEEMARETFAEARFCGASTETAMDDYNFVRMQRQKSAKRRATKRR
jgi:hypothetical protein